MSVAEMKQEAQALPEPQRRELSAFLIQLGRERNEAWRKEISQRMQDMDSGRKISQNDFERGIGLKKG